MSKRHGFLLEFLLWFSAAAVVAGTALVLLELAADDPDGLALAGSLGLVVTQTIALIGILVRRSSEEQADQRLRAETSIRAVELIQPGDPTPSSRAQAAAAALTLVDLGYQQSALSLVDALWKEGAIEGSAAVEVVSQNLDDAPLDAVLTLVDNADRTLSGPTYYFLKPTRFADREWLSSVAPDVQYQVIVYCQRVLALGTYGSRVEDPDPETLWSHLNQAMPELLALSGLDDDYDSVPNNDIFRYVDADVKARALVVVEAILPLFAALEYGLPAHGGANLSYEDVRTTLDAQISRVDPAFQNDPELDRIKQWVAAFRNARGDANPSGGE